MGGTSGSKAIRIWLVPNDEELSADSFSYPYLTVLEGISDVGYQIPPFHPASSFENQSPDGDVLHLVTTRGQNFTDTNIDLSRFDGTFVPVAPCR
ncbi:hypothetical protein FNW02_23760 [Komarekiella sp. 'clone 1']|uniref:Uncharacterized protein n=1 Tax=Komarekiella delphini-convector SJRDD-AB1 TaxID=2593771 RepID=A0AA40T161_9NOST|nr:hypothetical protein [Komarekiella delphini-convector]MBD6618759.1 hypothetical protein [Komarekiella delphini-convector SJRDD-AB1]